jgi:uncharacterized protein YcaQ
VDGIDWYWPVDERVEDRLASPGVRLLAPFDPIVWDRLRFALFWGWDYRFEAYTPPARRKLGYYALPLLWQDDVVGWGNASVSNGTLTVQIGYAGARAPIGRVFTRELDAELERMRAFLGAEHYTVGAIA